MRAHSIRQNIRWKKPKGFSLIELLVGIAIGLLATIIIFQTFQVNEAYRRSSVATGDTQTNASIAIYMIEKYMRDAGSNIVASSWYAPAVAGQAPPPVDPNFFLGCLMNGLPFAGNATTPAIPALRLAPALIADGGNGGADTLYVMAGASATGITPVTSTAPTLLAGATAISLSQLFGFRMARTVNGQNLPADTVLIANSETGATTISTIPCSLRQILNIAPPAAMGPGSITVNNALTVGYTTEPQILNMGANPIFVAFNVDPTTHVLQIINFGAYLQNPANQIQVTPIIDNVMSFQAQYGIDNNQDDNIDAWVEPTGNWALANLNTVDRPVSAGTAAVTPSAINRIKAIRLAIVVRSTEFEAADKTTGLCTAANAALGTGATPTWVPLPVRNAAGQPMPASTDIGSAIKAAAPGGTGAPAGSDWRCFRYRTYEAIIPVRSMIWSPIG